MNAIFPMLESFLTWKRNLPVRWCCSTCEAVCAWVASPRHAEIQGILACMVEEVRMSEKPWSSLFRVYAGLGLYAVSFGFKLLAEGCKEGLG